MSVYYEATIPKEVAQLFASGVETAYVQLVVKEGFRSPLERKISLKGSFKNYWALVNPDSHKCIGAHEFFHIVQHQYSLKLVDNFFLESTAMWAMQEVFPECREMYKESYEDWLLGGTDYNNLKLLMLGHQGGLFFDLVTQRYGGAQLIRRLFEHPDIRLGIAWPKVLGLLTGKSFLDLWIEFGVALADRKIPGAIQLNTLAESMSRYIPVPVYVGEWKGQSFSVTLSNWENPFQDICNKRTNRIRICPFSSDMLAVGSPLTIRHSYGIHFLRITPKSDRPFILTFEGASDTDFRVYLVAQKHSSASESFPINRGCMIQSPADYELFQLVITRGEKGSGTYRFNFVNPTLDEYPPCVNKQ